MVSLSVTLCRWKITQLSRTTALSINAVPGTDLAFLSGSNGGGSTLIQGWSGASMPLAGRGGLAGKEMAISITDTHTVWAIDIPTLFKS